MSGYTAEHIALALKAIQEERRFERSGRHVTAGPVLQMPSPCRLWTASTITRVTCQSPYESHPGRHHWWGQGPAPVFGDLRRSNHNDRADRTSGGPPSPDRKLQASWSLYGPARRSSCYGSNVLANLVSEFHYNTGYKPFFFHTRLVSRHSNLIFLHFHFHFIHSSFKNIINVTFT